MADSISAVGAVAPIAASAGVATPVAASPAAVAAAAAPDTAAPARPANSAPASPAEVQATVDALNKAIEPLQTDLHFQVDKVTGQLVVSVIDQQDGKVLLQVPSQEALSIAQSLERTLLLDRKA